VDHGVVHPLQRCAVGLVQSSDYTGNAAHQVGSFRSVLSHDLPCTSQNVRGPQLGGLP
jgi:hypothetical protein